jgi:hypothetical protein
MKTVITSLIFLFVLIGLSGCYTVPQHFADNNEYTEVNIYYEVPLPSPPPVEYFPPVPNPAPVPIVRQPAEEKNRNGSGNQVRDPLRNNGRRGTEERKIQGRQ